MAVVNTAVTGIAMCHSKAGQPARLGEDSPRRDPECAPRGEEHLRGRVRVRDRDRDRVRVRVRVRVRGSGLGIGLGLGLGLAP